MGLTDVIELKSVAETRKGDKVHLNFSENCASGWRGRAGRVDRGRGVVV